MAESLLSRVPASTAASSPLQGQVDHWVGGFAEQAADWKSLAAMTAGGLAYRSARIGMMGLGGANGVRAASVGLGLAAEVSTFEFSHRALQPAPSQNPNLWKWSGLGGIRQGLFQSFITFGTLKGAGRLAAQENFVVQHALQDAAMVAGHQISGALNLAPRPQGSLAEQFLHAEATNLQIGAGMALAHGLAPGILSFERGLHLSLQTAPLSRPESRKGEGTKNDFVARLTRRLSPQWATEGPPLLLMAASQEPGFKGSLGERLDSLEAIRDRVRGPEPLQEGEGVAMTSEIVNNKNQPLAERYELLLELAFHEGFKDFDSILNGLAKLSEQGGGIADLEPLFEKATATPLLQEEPGSEKITHGSIDQAFRSKPLTFTLVFRLLMQAEAGRSLKKTLLGNDFPELNNERADGALLSLALGALASHPELKEPRHFHRVLEMLKRSGADSDSLGFTLRELVREPRYLDDLSFRYIFELLPFTLNEKNGAFSFHTQEVLDKVLENPHFNAAEHLENYLSTIQVLTDSANMRTHCYAMISAHPRFQGAEAYRILLAAIFQEKASADMALKAGSLVFSRPTFTNIHLALEIISRSKARSLTKLAALKELSDNPNVDQKSLLSIVSDIREDMENPQAKVDVLKHILDSRFIYDHAILEEMAEEFLSYVVRPRRKEPSAREMALDLEKAAGPLLKIVANPVLPPDSYRQIQSLIMRFPILTMVDRQNLMFRLQAVFDRVRAWLN